MNIQEIRQTYPQYNNLSDEELADKLYVKYAGKLPKDEFYERIGFTQKQPSFGERVAQIPGKLGEFAAQLPGEIAGVPKQLLNDPLRAGKVAAKSAGEFAKNVATKNIYNRLLNQEIPEEQTLESKFDRFSKLPAVQKAFDTGQYQQGDMFFNMLPFLSAPELRLEGVPYKTLPNLGARVAESELYETGTDNPDYLMGAAFGAAMPSARLAGKGISTGAKSFLPSNFLRRNISADDLEKNARAAGSSKVNIAKVTESPMLNKLYENIIAESPFSGADTSYKQVGDHVQNKGENLLGELVDNPVMGDPNDVLKDALENVHEESRAIKNSLFEPVNRRAEKEGFSIDLSSSGKLAKKNYNTLSNSALLKDEPEIKSFLRRVSGLKRGAEDAGTPFGTVDPISGKPVMMPPSPITISDAHTLKNKLYNYGQMSTKSPAPLDRKLGKTLVRLSGKIGDDINNSINTLASPALKKLYDKAMGNYKNNYTQFLDENIYKYLHPSTDAQSIARDIISPSSRNDKYKKIEAINKILPADSKNLLGYAYLHNAVDSDNKLNINKLDDRLKALGPRQFNALFPEKETRQNVSDFVKLKSMGNEALNRMANPATGKRSLAYLMSFILGKAVSIPAAVGTVAGARMLQHAMSSPEIRNRLVKKMIEKERKQPSKSSRDIARLLDMAERGATKVQPQEQGGQ